MGGLCCGGGGGVCGLRCLLLVYGVFCEVFRCLLVLVCCLPSVVCEPCVVSGFFLCVLARVVERCLCGDCVARPF